MFVHGKRQKRRKNIKILMLPIFVLIALGGILYYHYYFASAAFTGSNGDVAWGDTGTGRIRLSKATYSTTSPYLSYGTNFRPATAPDVSSIQFVALKTSPVR